MEKNQASSDWHSFKTLPATHRQIPSADFHSEPSNRVELYPDLVPISAEQNSLLFPHLTCPTACLDTIKINPFLKKRFVDSFWL